MEQPNDKQAHIIEVAQKLFATNGFAGTSVRDIAKEADVNVAMISYYFGSKEKLLEAIFNRHWTNVRLQLENLLHDESKSPLDKVYILIDNYLDKYFAQQDFHKIIVREQMAHREDGPLSEMMHQMKKGNQSLIKQLITDGQKKGVFKKNIDVPLMMATMMGTANQLLTTQRFYKEINGLQDMPEEDFQKLLRKKLTIHLKTLFKSILTYEA
ncbi:MAG: TetR/AcrR family transcriptional regulator [Sphingobacteriales bacterium]|nr:MAG: TetR/AcrR family transcriptional regulator [Sphingobacteriales bacterium]